MKPSNRQEIWAILTSEPVSAVLLAVVVLGLLMLGTVLFPAEAKGGECVQRVQKHVKKQTVLVPYNYGHKNLLVEIPADAVFSEVYQYKYALPIQTYEPVQYTPAPPGDGLAQPQLIQRVIETYEAGSHQSSGVSKAPNVEATGCKSASGLSCETGRVASVSPGLLVAQESCASCHTGAKAKAAHRPAFWNDAGDFVATEPQKQRMLTSAKVGTMPPDKPLSDDEYLALSNWLTPPKAAPTVEELMAEIQALKAALKPASPAELFQR